MDTDRANNLRHQHGYMHIAVTITFVWIYGKITKVALCNENLICGPNVSILVLYFTRNANLIQILVTLDTLTNYASISSITEYQHGLSKCQNILWVSKAQFFERQTVHMTKNFVL